MAGGFDRLHQGRADPLLPMADPHRNPAYFPVAWRLFDRASGSDGLATHQCQDVKSYRIKRIKLFLDGYILLVNKDFRAYGKTSGEVRGAKIRTDDLNHAVTNPTIVVWGGMSGRNVGQRVAGLSKLAVGVAPGCRTDPKAVLVSASKATPPAAAPTGAR